MGRVFIVDDSAAMRRMVKRSVLKFDIEEEDIEEFENGQLALDRISESTPELLLCDVNMPVMTGTELLRALGERSLMHGIPIVMITSVSKTRQLLELTRLGAQKVIRKPFSAESLDRELRELLIVPEAANDPVIGVTAELVPDHVEGFIKTGIFNGCARQAVGQQAGSGCHCRCGWSGCRVIIVVLVF